MCERNTPKPVAKAANLLRRNLKRQTRARKFIEASSKGFELFQNRVSFLHIIRQPTKLYIKLIKKNVHRLRSCVAVKCLKSWCLERQTPCQDIGKSFNILVFTGFPATLTH